MNRALLPRVLELVHPGRWEDACGRGDDLAHHHALPAAGPTWRNASFQLALAQDEQWLRVVSLQAGRNLDRRLTGLGLNVGSRVRVLQRRGGGVVIARDTVRVALGAGVAAKILVVPD